MIPCIDWYKICKIGSTGLERLALGFNAKALGLTTKKPPKPIPYSTIKRKAQNLVKSHTSDVIQDMVDKMSDGHIDPVVSHLVGIPNIHIQDHLDSEACLTFTPRNLKYHEDRIVVISESIFECEQNYIHASYKHIKFIDANNRRYNDSILLIPEGIVDWTKLQHLHRCAHSLTT